jgi:2-amino-4-hydroxy-6-hydroxymethyldihydropteridine diphosphokinase
MDSNKTAYILLGTNLGDRFHLLHAAIDLIRTEIGSLISISSIYETAPWGVLDQPSFLNQVIAVSTHLIPAELLQVSLHIEQKLGRVRHEKWGARLIDIDMLYYEQEIILSDDLIVPHPRLHERRFTLAPLAEIAPHFLHPILNKTNEELLLICGDSSDVQRISNL